MSEVWDSENLLGAFPRLRQIQGQSPRTRIKSAIVTTATERNLRALTQERIFKAGILIGYLTRSRHSWLNMLGSKDVAKIVVRNDVMEQPPPTVISLTRESVA
jgi:hypothetical protein